MPLMKCFLLGFWKSECPGQPFRAQSQLRLDLVFHFLKLGAPQMLTQELLIRLHNHSFVVKDCAISSDLCPESACRAGFMKHPSPALQPRHASDSHNNGTLTCSSDAELQDSGECAYMAHLCLKHSSEVMFYPSCWCLSSLPWSL